MAHTDSLPRLDQEMIDEWGRQQLDVAKRVRISSTAKILGPDDISEHDVRVWRKGLSPKVEEFVRAALQAFEREASPKLYSFFDPYSRVSLDDAGNLVGLKKKGRKRERLLAQTLADLFTHPDIDPSLALAFAEHVLDSLRQSLAQLPAGKYLTPDPGKESQPRGQYSTFNKPSFQAHDDGKKTLLLQYTNPGAPYSRYKYEEPSFKTTTGDVTMHGKAVWHGFPTAPAENGAARLRLCLGFFIN